MQKSKRGKPAALFAIANRCGFGAGGADGNYFIMYKNLQFMSEQNSLKMLLSTARNEADLDLFLYTALGVVGTSGIVEIVADAMRDDLIKALNYWATWSNFEQAVLSEIMHLAALIKNDFAQFMQSKKAQSKRNSDGQLLSFYSETVSAFKAISDAYGGCGKNAHSERLCEILLSVEKPENNLFAVFVLGNSEAFVFAKRPPMRVGAAFREQEYSVNHIFNFLRSN